MRVAVAENGIVENIIEAASIAVAKTLFPSSELFNADSNGAGVGWVKDGKNWRAPEAPPAAPAVLTHLQFIEHIQEVGQVSDEDLVAAKADASLAAFWIKFDMAQGLERDNPTTQAGLSALVATGHLTQAKAQAVIDNWPTV